MPAVVPLTISTRPRLMWVPALVARLVKHQPSPQVALGAMWLALHIAFIEIRIGRRMYRRPASRYLTVTVERV
jgi:hypothetical protein